ncbi:MAG: ATP-binding protein [Candidatus Omnitrophota bacterium]
MHNCHMYINRLLAGYILKASRSFPVVLLTGPRQSGKTTLLRKISEDKRNFVSLDDLVLRNLAINDPKLFFQRFKPPLVIDEIQYAPGLLSYIKLLVDEKATKLKKANGLFWLSGSQNFTLMDNVSESLAGRVAIMKLLGCSHYEYSNDVPVDKQKPFFTKGAKISGTPLNVNKLFKFILRGAMPKLLADKKVDAEQYYSSYVQTYIERDIRGQIGAGSLMAFESFIRLLAARATQLLNMASLAQEIGVSLNTVKSWVSLLEKTFQIYILRPYHSNLNKREIKTPKVYFLDTGLLCYLTQWQDSATALAGPMAGAIFENWVVSELIKSYWHRAKEAPFYFYRTKEGIEIDLFCVEANKIIASEIKLSATPNIGSIQNLARLVSKKINIKEEWVFSQSEAMLPLTSKITVFPASCIF